MLFPAPTLGTAIHIRVSEGCELGRAALSEAGGHRLMWNVRHLQVTCRTCRSSSPSAGPCSGPFTVVPQTAGGPELHLRHRGALLRRGRGAGQHGGSAGADDGPALTAAAEAHYPLLSAPVGQPEVRCRSLWSRRTPRCVRYCVPPLSRPPPERKPSRAIWEVGECIWKASIRDCECSHLHTTLRQCPYMTERRI